MLKSVSILVAVLLTACLSVRAQVSFEHLTPSDGLSQSTVWELVQDKKGFIWMATADGLNRYDGYSFKVFRQQPDQPRTLSGNDIATVFADRNGAIWAGPRKGGLCRLREDGETFEHFRVAAGGRNIAQISISCFAEADGKLWFGTSEDGLFYYDYVRRQVHPVNRAEIGPSVMALYRDTAGRLWIGTGSGKLLALAFRDHRLTVYAIPFQKDVVEQHRGISILQEDRFGRFWVGTSGQGLFRFEPAGGTFSRVFYRPGVYETMNIITDVVEDRPGNLWVITDFGALLYPKGEIRTPELNLPDIDNEKSLSTHALKKALRDSEGNLWIGTWQGGVNILRAESEKFVSIGHQPRNPQSLLTAKVTAVAHDRHGDLWVGSNKGLTHLSADRKRFEHFTTRNSPLGSDDISALFSTPAGNLLISAWTSGFVFYDAARQRFYPFTNLGISKSVKGFARARDGRVWVCTHEKELYLFDEKTHRVEAVDISPLRKAHERFDFNEFLEDASGNLWIGTYNSGLLRWNRRSGAVRYYSADGRRGSLGGNSITCLYEDGLRRLWIGTNGAGLNRYDRRTDAFVRITTKNGLSNNFISGIREDRRQNLWLSSNGGISWYDPRTGSVENYYPSDGLVGREFLPRASTDLPNGELAFGNMQGLVVFRPERVRQKAAPPRVYLSDLKLFNRPVNPSDEDAPSRVDMTDARKLVFRASQSVFTLEFTGISYLYNRNIRYAFKLDGFEPDWNYVGRQRSATYTNLREGTYTFLVKSAVGNSDWSRPVSVVIEVLPPWYRTWWAYSLYGMVFLGLLYALRRVILIRERLKADIRIKQIEAENIKALDDAKTSFFTNISHEFRTPLTLILTPLEKLVAERSFEEHIQRQLLTIQRNGQRLLRLVNQLLDLSKLESRSLIPDISRNDVVPFVERIVRYFEELAEKKRVALQFKSNYDAFDGFFDPDIVEKILYNLLSNALKFTPEGGEVRVTLLVTAAPSANTLTITVQDTGVGISPENLSHIFERFYQVNGHDTQKKSGSGIGLALTRELVELHRGRIEVESTEKAGTTFQVTLPLDEQAFPEEWLSFAAEPVAENGPPLLPVIVEERLAVHPAKSLPLLLIVEDNEELRNYLKEQFSSTYHVLTASDGRQAQVQARKHVPDLVISDWLMPEMDGAELCRTLKADEKTSHIPFLLLTSRSSSQSQLNAFDTGIDDYVTKPFNLSLLEARVKGLILNRQALREKFGKRLLTGSEALSLPPKEEQFIKKTIQIIEAHLDDPHFDAEQLEDAMNMSRMQFYRKLKSLVNLSGTEFIRQVRLKCALQLLESRQYNVSEVAWKVGFNDPAYFSRCFKKEFGKSPQEYLTKH
ncbi:hybrid sensor histidine kinase/response regulator transcription factor [Larkinella soli]|uniref:hybrid sensor histidine kinase/response regulator transcription factor n=1 Tax=Larkinella soli TaxID=1770527 RepID=UPI000FFB6F86|nr:hybrid sensor histidine kinase/response regulator transcription factor [Larkinella soli]